MDTGDSEALEAGAAAALIASQIGADKIKPPKGLGIPSKFRPSDALVARAREASNAIATHSRIPEFVPARWISGIRRLAEFLAGAEAAR